MIVTLTVGRGAFSFYRPEIELAALPRVGDDIAAGPNGQVYTVDAVVITPDRIYIRCEFPFGSENEAMTASSEWPSVATVRRRRRVVPLTAV